MLWLSASKIDLAQRHNKKAPEVRTARYACVAFQPHSNVDLNTAATAAAAAYQVATAAAVALLGWAMGLLKKERPPSQLSPPRSAKPLPGT